MKTRQPPPPSAGSSPLPPDAVLLERELLSDNLGHFVRSGAVLAALSNTRTERRPFTSNVRRKEPIKCRCARTPFF